jgi:hypothetical protein
MQWHTNFRITFKLNGTYLQLFKQNFRVFLKCICLLYVTFLIIKRSMNNIIVYKEVNSELENSCKKKYSNWISSVFQWYWSKVMETKIWLLTSVNGMIQHVNGQWTLHDLSGWWCHHRRFWHVVAQLAKDSPGNHG